MLSKTKLAPGPAIVELYNRGEDAHDVRIKRGGPKQLRADPRDALGGRAPGSRRRFKAGKRYVLWCSLEGHRELGMEAELHV